MGRSTFTAITRVRELLLDELCQKLFHHLFERAEHLSPQDYLAHIFQHFKKIKIMWPVSCSLKTIILSGNCMKELEHDVYPMVADELIKSHPTIPTPISNTWSSPILSKPQLVVEKRQVLHRTRRSILFGDFKSGLELEKGVFSMTSVQFYFHFHPLHASRTRKKSFGCHPLIKKYQPVSK